jgi:DNA-binding PadR family transcriptional regulator
MHMRYALLALLVDGEAHGYQLLETVSSPHRAVLASEHRQVYQVLHDLEHRALIARAETCGPARGSAASSA